MNSPVSRSVATSRRAYWRQKYYGHYTLHQRDLWHLFIYSGNLVSLKADLMFAKCLGQPCQLLLIASSVFSPPWPDGMQTQVGNYLSFLFVDFQIRVSLWDFQRFQHVNNLLLRQHHHHQHHRHQYRHLHHFLPA